MTSSSLDYSSLEHKSAMATLVQAKRVGIDLGSLVGTYNRWNPSLSKCIARPTGPFLAGSP